MPLKPDAEAVARLDAICDEYEEAIRSGKIEIDDETLHSLETWVQRTSPELRSWLREELCELRQCLLSRDDSEESQLLPQFDDIDDRSWQAVQSCDTFGPLSELAKSLLAGSLESRCFETGDLLLKSGEHAQGLFLITEGEVQVTAGAGEGGHQIDTDGAGAVLGEMSLITGYPCSADVVATAPTKALVLPVDAFETLRQAHPEIEISLSQLVSDRLGHRRRDALCGKVLGGYRLDRCISSGAMGVVYVAHQAADGTRRALKMLRHRFISSPRVISRFDREVELLQRLEHPNIIKLCGHFIAYRTRFMVLEFIDGPDLRTVIRRLGRLPESSVRKLLGQIAAGLQYAHLQGVLHLDLKPANLLINHQGRISITDFGLSRLIESDGGDRDCVGTPHYMPPEQFMMADLGPHCDWYAFACIAYELLTGQRLFQSDESPQFLDDKLRTPSAAWPRFEASATLSRQVRAALQPMPMHRRLDLDKIAAWAQPAPEIVQALH
ncbi:MAG: protein kinase [Pirellulales bacterium]|nr:protein kinase [Pirellulales bacterium]